MSAPTLPMLTLATVANALGDDARYFDLDVAAECGSTNAELLAHAEAGAPSGSALAAENQTAGRGRRGRAWVSAPGDSLTFSLLWRFPAGTDLSGLSLAVGVALARALDEEPGLQLKWPNDLLKFGRKLAGVLIEGVSSQPGAVVIGIGVNLRLPEAMPNELRATSAALAPTADPSLVLARFLTELRPLLADFGREGFVPLRDEWLGRCIHRDIDITLLSDFAPPVVGRCCGVAPDGALLLETETGILRVISGEVSLRFTA
jgi:BirA family transcriptional regulator, biotin operon repressor / biotin---[acetyl-CoA-carboxylase] ligase